MLFAPTLSIPPALAIPTTPFGSSGNLSNISGSTVTVSNADGYAAATFTLSCPSGNASVVNFEQTYDTYNWFPCTFRRVGNDGYVQWTSGNDSYVGSIAGAQAFRVRVVNSGFGPGSIIGSLQRYVSTLEGVENGPPSEFMLNIAEGKVAGYDIVNKFGRNPDIGTGTLPEDIWNGGGVYPGFPLASFERVRVLSNQTGDHMLGFGARQVQVVGLDSNYNPLNEIIFLSGTTPSTGVNVFSRIFGAIVPTGGVSGINLGEITCQYSGQTGVVFFRMPSGANQTFTANYTVPAGKTAYLRQMYASVNRGFGTGIPIAREADVCLMTRTFGALFRQRRPTNLSNNAPLEYVIEGGLRLTEKTDIMIRCTSVSSDQSDISAGYDLIVIDN